MEEIEVGRDVVTMGFASEARPERETIAAMVKKALLQAGKTPWAEVELDMFSGHGQTLVVARPGQCRCYGFFFSSLSDLLGGTLACTNGASGLYRADGGYVLTVGGDSLCSALYEFGWRQLGRGPLWQSHAREQGQCILEENAISELKRWFVTGSNDCETGMFVV